MPHEAIVPPASVAVIFEHGGAAKTKAPAAKKLGVPSPPQRPAAQPSHAPSPKPVPPAKPVAAPAPSPPQPPPEIVPAKPAPLPSPALSAALPSPSGELSVRLPEPKHTAPALHAELMPSLPRPAPPAPPTPPAPRLRTSPSAHPVPRAAPAPRSPHYLVMNRPMSFGGAAAPSAPSHGLNLALNRSVLNAQVSNELTIEGKIGPDWKAELTRWVNEHKYYPNAAVQMGQQGAVEIRFVVDHTGRVLKVLLLNSSGSPFLDQAWLGLFRGAALPPFPPGTKARELTIRATMHYILID